MFLNALIKKIEIKIANSSNKRRISYLRKKGAKIGENTVLLCGVSSFGTEPYLISVGRNCLFSGGIHLITHDGGISVLNKLNYFDGVNMDKIAPIKIGNNVYIGSGAYIMPGVTIGDNSIIGGCAVVTKDVFPNTVVAGVPGRAICTIKEYYDKLVKRNILYPTADMTHDDKKEYFMSLGIHNTGEQKNDTTI